MDYKDIFQKFNNLNVVVIGDIMVDSYQWGKVERISPEAPVPICAVTKIENRLGGAGNVALNLKAMGANPILCSVIGEDSNGENLLHLMQQEGMTTDYILQSTDRPTTTKTRIIGNNSQMLRIDNESIETLDRKEETAFLKRIESLFSKMKIDVVIFQDYDKGVITERVITTTTSQANKKNIPITVDPKHRNFSLYKDVAMFKPNLKELKEGLKIEFDKPTQENLENASLLLKDKQRIEKVFITLSEYGVFFADYSKKQAKVVLLPANVRKIADVSGAGDTVISVASLCLALDIEPKEIAKISNLAGGLVCE